jgi:Icc-related predicted phosphoesterase
MLNQESRAMRCLLVSDLHYTLKQFDWVLSQAGIFDVIVIAGDHLDIASTVDIQAQTTVILSYVKRIYAKSKIIVCSGNHDLDARSQANEKYARWILRARKCGAHTDYDRAEIGGALFTVCPWWDGPESCARVGAHIERDSRLAKERWIWVYHAPPDASPTSWGGKQYFGDPQLLKWIERFSPDMVLAGHIHQSPFKEGGSWVDRIGTTWIFNPGRQIGPCPTHIILDTLEQRALWFSMDGAEEISLNQDLTRPVSPLTRLPDWLSKRYPDSARSPA